MTPGKNKVIVFVATGDPSQARIFYQDVLGLTLIDAGDQALIFDANGTQLRISIVPDPNPPRYTVLGWDVPDIKRAMEVLGHRGVTFEYYERLPQDKQRVCTFPNGDQVAWFTDPDGNTLSLTQFP